MISPRPGVLTSALSNLTTVGAIPYVSSSGVLNQDPTALFWDAANDRLGVGTAVPDYKLHVDALTTAPVVHLNSSNATPIWLQLTSGATVLGSIDRTANDVRINSYGDILLNPGTGETGNVLIGGTTDGNYKLDVQASGSTGTVKFMGQEPTVGTTLVTIQAGAGQSGNLLSVRNNAGTEMVGVNTGGGLLAGAFYNTNDSFYQQSTVVDIASNFLFRFSSTTSQGGTKDLGLYRNSSGVLEINAGTAGTYRDLIARRTQTGPVAVSALPAASAGLAGSIQAVSDALAPAWGVTVAGGGAAYALVTCNGAAWTVIGV